MNDSLSFERAAGFYDQTRPLFEPAARLGIQAILEQAGASARILDVGTGTGRISVPLLERGADLVGCDLSPAMLRRLQKKRPEARILQADASRLPFPGARFDAVLTVHVMHLIAPWQEALREFKRVLSSNGVYLNVRTAASVGPSVRERMRTFWRTWVEAHGVQIHQPGIRDFEQFRRELRSLGATLSEVDVVHFPIPLTIREELGRFVSRAYSDAWDIPDDVHAASMEALQTWVDQEYGDLDRRYEDEGMFVVDVGRFES
ncbi:MAG: class I SAM-dependent methyltransferase [Bacteroidota bacterium]